MSNYRKEDPDQGYKRVVRVGTADLSLADPIFTSLSGDYPGFADWFSPAQEETRDCLVSRGADGRIGAIVIVKIEADGAYDLGERVLKVCTLKVAPECTGRGLESILFQSIVRYARENDLAMVYSEVLPEYEELQRLYMSHGYRPLDVPSSKGELVYVRTVEGAASTPRVIDAAVLARQHLWGVDTFGEGALTDSILAHIASELEEIRKAPSDILEWADVAILALSGAQRAGYDPQEVIDAIIYKLDANEHRRWPERKDMDFSGPVHHLDVASSSNYSVCTN